MNTLLDFEQQEGVLTLFNTLIANENFTLFGRWLSEGGASKVTRRNYEYALQKWLEYLKQNSNMMPAAAWLRWNVSSAMKRLAGFAARRYQEFAKTVLRETVDLGIPSRLPAASRPNPHPIQGGELRQLRLTAKAIFPQRTGYSMRVWLSFMEELGLRRGESDVEWTQIDLLAATAVVRGKTGERELPLSKQMLRRLHWLKKRNPAFPWLGARKQRLSPAVLYKLFKQLAAAAGLSNLRPHLLRHRRLTLLCRTELGKNQLAVLSFSGHAHLSSLQHYYAVSVEEKRALLQASLGSR